RRSDLCGGTWPRMNRFAANTTTLSGVPAQPTIGVLALQGDVQEHLAALERLGTSALAVRRPAELDRCDALVIPGGESTTIGKLARAFGLFEPIVERLRGGMPALGTCAGMIMLADRVVS